jgi:hypothetical protein
MPFGLGGDHSPENIRLLCRAHNAYMAEQDYGKAKMSRHLAVPSAGALGGLSQEAQRAGEPPAAF